MTKINVATVLLWMAAASSQAAELGGIIGAGAISNASQGAVAAGQVGLDACLGCGGHFGLFGEYRHWFSAGNPGFDRVKSADLAGGGLRIQTLARIFFDVGLVGGRDRHSGGRGGGLGGVVIGAGAAIPLTGHWLLRPQLRAYGLSPHTLEGVDAHWAVSGALGISYRF